MADASARNISFELTEAFNDTASAVAPASGQAVVCYRVAIRGWPGDGSAWPCDCGVIS